MTTEPPRPTRRCPACEKDHEIERMLFDLWPVIHCPGQEHPIVLPPLAPLERMES